MHFLFYYSTKPFVYYVDIDDPPVVCLTSTASQSEDDVNVIFVTRKEVEGNVYIQMVLLLKTV
jgi:hypothetical protein